MTTGDVITNVIEDHINPGGSQATDADLRTRLRRALQRVVTRFWMFRPFAWTFGSGTVTMGTGADAGAGDVPANFGTMGPKFRVTISGETRRPLIYVEPGAFFELRRTSTSTASRPSYYTIRETDKDGDRKIHVHPTNSGALTLQLDNYKKIRPTLIDRPPAPTVAATVTAGLPSGAYTYKTTKVTADGETEGSPESASITVTLLQITVTVPIAPEPGVTARKVYRTVAGGSDWKLAGTIADNTTTTFTDNVADAALGASVPTSSTAVTGLEYVPEQYHDGLLFDALVTLSMRSQGDARSASEMPATVSTAFAQAWAEENPHHVARRLPRYGRGMRTR